MAVSLVIGGSSQIAFYVIKKSLDRGEEVIATFRSQNSLQERLQHLASAHVDLRRLTTIIIESLSDFDIDHAISSFSIDLIYYFSAINLPSTVEMSIEDSRLMRRVHVDATSEILKVLTKHSLTRAVFALSSSIFKPLEFKDRNIGVNSAPNPSDLYGKTKLESWERIKLHRSIYGSQVSGLVLFNYESSYRMGSNRSNFLIHKLAKDLAEIKADRRNEFSVNSFSSRNDWSHAIDIADGILEVAKSKNLKDYVIGSGFGQSIKQILEESLLMIDDKQLNKRCSFLIPEEISYEPCVIAEIDPITELLGRSFQGRVSQVVQFEYMRLLKS